MNVLLEYLALSSFAGENDIQSQITSTSSTMIYVLPLNVVIVYINAYVIYYFWQFLATD